MGTKRQTLDQGVARFLRAWRRREGETQDFVAWKAQQVGLDWNRSTIAAIEAGRKTLSFGEAIALCYLLSISGDPVVKPSDFLGDVDALDVTVILRARSSHVRDLIEGRLEELDAFPFLEAFTDDRPFGWVGIGNYISAEIWDREAERNVARRLGISPESLIRAAKTIWGQALSEERDKRLLELEYGDRKLSARSLQAHRGHVTRRLMDELQDHPRQRKTGRSR